MKVLLRFVFCISKQRFMQDGPPSSNYWCALLRPLGTRTFTVFYLQRSLYSALPVSWVYERITFGYGGASTSQRFPLLFGFPWDGFWCFLAVLTPSTITVFLGKLFKIFLLYLVFTWDYDITSFYVHVLPRFDFWWELCTSGANETSSCSWWRIHTAD